VLPLHQGGTRAVARNAPSSLPDGPVPAVALADAGRIGCAPGTGPPADNGGMPNTDEVDRIVSAWLRERPDLDFSPLQVFSRLDRLSKHLDRARRSAFTGSDLEPPDFDVLAALRRAGTPYQLSPKALLQQTLVSSGTMTNRIDRLVTRGLVERRTDPNDGRGILVQMTELGRTRVDAAITELVSQEAGLLATLTRADQERLAALLRKLSLDFD
jgi:DNA-binding MarR family transcriptional regulator